MNNLMQILDDNFEGKDTVLGKTRKGQEILEFSFLLNSMSIEEFHKEVFNPEMTFNESCYEWAKNNCRALTNKDVDSVIRASGCLPDVKRMESA